MKRIQANQAVPYGKEKPRRQAKKSLTPLRQLKNRASRVFRKYTLIFLVGLFAYLILFIFPLFGSSFLSSVMPRYLPFDFIFMMMGILAGLASYETLKDILGKQIARNCGLVVACAFLMLAVFIKIIF